MILVVGDIILDSYCIGEVTRISPEAPVPILNVTKEYDLLGGAANVASGIQSLEQEVNLFGLIGSDINGDRVVTLLKDKQINQSLMRFDGMATISKTRLIADAYQLARIDRERTSIPLVSPELIMNGLSSLINGAEYIVISDYGKGLLDQTVTQYLINSSNVPVLIDPKGSDWEKYRNAFLITPNIKEVEHVLDLSVSNVDESIENAILTLKGKYNIQNILVTRSEKGMTLFYDDQFHHLPAKAQKVFDVTGAGDTVIATTASYLSKGKDLLQAVVMANYAAGISIANIGAYTVSINELSQYE